jgi:molybdate transport system ATP-binding protein
VTAHGPARRAVDAQSGLDVRASVRLRDFTLEIDLGVGPAERVAVFGPSGSGKTTLLRAVAGLMRPDSGLISVGGRRVFDSAERIDLAPEERRCGFVSQGVSLFPHLDAASNVAYAMRGGRFGTARRERREQAVALLGSFGLAHLASELPSHLSGGEAQRVAIARAVASEPAAFLLDEPLASLDRETSARVTETLAAALEMAAVPALLVTHSPDEASRMCGTSLTVEAGRISNHENRQPRSPDGTR